MSSISVRLSDELKERLDREVEEGRSNRSEVVRAALRTYLDLKEFTRLRRQMIPSAKSQGIYSDDDVFEEVS
ncbi:MAG: ribbon-helix-helix domain-containing protein [Bradymonadaceae bacterium]